MKKAILIFTLISCMFINSFGQETPSNLLLKARILTRDSVHLVGNTKELIQETKALIQEVQKLAKKTKFKKNRLHKSQIGFTFQPFNFKNYQSQEGAGGTKLIKSKSFNGFAAGLTFRKKLTKHFSLRTELSYATQNEKFDFSAYSISNAVGENTYIYNGEDKLTYNVIRLPLLMDYNLKLGFSGWSIHGYTGLQLAYLNSYVRKYHSYEVDYETKHIDRSILFNEVFERNGKGYAKILDPNNPEADQDGYLQNFTIDRAKNAVFRIWSLALVGGFEVEKAINSKYSIGFGARYEYNITKTESSNYDGHAIIYNFGGGDNIYSHQRRIGMTLSLLKTIHN